MDPDLRDLIIVFGIGGIIVVVWFLNDIGRSRVNAPTEIEKNKEFTSANSFSNSDYEDEDDDFDEVNIENPYYESDEAFINRIMSQGEITDYDNDPAYKDFPKKPFVNNNGKTIN